MTASAPAMDDRTAILRAREADGIVRCEACPVLCRIRPGRAGACHRYANRDGELIRTDPLFVLDRGGAVVPFLDTDWDGSALRSKSTFITAIGAGTTYPDYKPAPFIVGSQHAGVDTVTVVTEGIFSYCELKVKLDTDRNLGRLPADAFGSMPTPALVAPIEFTMRRDVFAALGGHTDQIVPMEKVIADYGATVRRADGAGNPWPDAP